MAIGQAFDPDSAKRIARVVRIVEREPRNRRPAPRAKYPILGGGKGLIPVQITERLGELPEEPPHPDEDTRDPVVVHRYAPWILDATAEPEDVGFEVMRLSLVRDELVVKEDAKRETAYADFFSGVHWTGKRVFCIALFGKLFVVSDGADFFSEATAIDDIEEAGGTIRLWGDEEDSGPEVEAESLCGGTVAADTAIVVEFDDQAQLFKVTDKCCPVESEE